MANAAARGSAAPKPHFKIVLLRLLLALLLAASVEGLAVCAARMETAAKLAGAAADARAAVDNLLLRVARVAGRLQGADTSSGRARVALAARMLRLERSLAPAQSLFLYDAEGRFVAATRPLLPDEADVSRSAWFRSMAKDPQLGVMTLIAGARAPLGDDEGVIIAKSIAGRSGAFAGEIGTFVSWPAFRDMLSPSSLPPGSKITLVLHNEKTPILNFWVGTRAPRTWLDSAVPWLAAVLSTSVTAKLPGGFAWHAETGPLAGLSIAEACTLCWMAPFFAAGLLALLALRPRTASKRRIEAEQAAPIETAFEPDWLWELDASGRLVGVGGNAPKCLIAAVGTKFLNLVEDKPGLNDLRDALSERTPVCNLELALALPDAAAGPRCRVVLNGCAVEKTGGFWGTAAEIDPPLERLAEAAD